ncbi:MAG: FlgD immunoglobulin-like domain containing protein [Candidatus Eisenbacteria bacterium]
MNARTIASKRSGSAFVALVCLTAALLALSSPAVAIKRGTESVNCGGAASQSASFKAHDTIAQCPIGPVGEGGGMRIYDGFWLTLPNINVPVEGAVFAVLSDAGTPLVRWTVGSLDGMTGFNVYRAIAEDGPFDLITETPLAPESPNSFEDTTTWPQTTFWYEVRSVFPDGTEDVVAGSPARVSTEGRLALRLFPLRPNPMSGSASVSFDIPDHSGPVHLVIYNVRGQRVSTVVDGPVDRGRHERTWDGNDDRGAAVASGVYFARLLVDGRADDQKVMVLR